MNENRWELDEATGLGMYCTCTDPRNNDRVVGFFSAFRLPVILCRLS